jgi:histidinol-phosphate aminotransferase
VSAVLAAHAANPHTKLLFFCSPNNPTANLLDRDDILYIANALFGKAIIVVGAHRGSVAQKRADGDGA